VYSQTIFEKLRTIRAKNFAHISREFVGAKIFQSTVERKNDIHIYLQNLSSVVSSFFETIKEKQFYDVLRVYTNLQFFLNMIVLYYKCFHKEALLPSTLKADSHIAGRSHAAPMPFLCHAVPLRV